MLSFHIIEQLRAKVQVSLLVPSCAEVLLRVFRTISLFLAFLTDGFSFAVILSGILQNPDVEEVSAQMLITCIALMRSRLLVARPALVAVGGKLGTMCHQFLACNALDAAGPATTNGEACSAVFSSESQCVLFLLADCAFQLACARGACEALRFVCLILCACAFDFA